MTARLLLALLLAVPAAARAEEPRVDLGFAVQAGSKHFRGIRIPAADLFTMEGRLYLDERTSVDARVDCLQWFFSATLTSSPRLPMSVAYHLRRPLGERWSLGLAPGLDTAWGWDRLVVDERLVRRPGATVAVSAKLGFERRGKRERFDHGVYARMSEGLALSAQGGTRVSKVLLEMTFTWRLRS